MRQQTPKASLNLTHNPFELQLELSSQDHSGSDKAEPKIKRRNTPDWEEAKDKSPVPAIKIRDPSPSFKHEDVSPFGLSQATPIPREFPSNNTLVPFQLRVGESMNPSFSAHKLLN